jgi:hypothetical protein
VAVIYERVRLLDDKQEQAFTYQELEGDLRAVTNDLGNLYRVPLAPILKAARRHIEVK